MRLYEFSVTFGYVVAADAAAVMVYAPHGGDVAQRVLSYWVMNVPRRAVIYLTDPQQARRLTCTDSVLRAIDSVTLKQFVL